MLRAATAALEHLPDACVLGRGVGGTGRHAGVGRVDHSEVHLQTHQVVSARCDWNDYNGSYVARAVNTRTLAVCMASSA